MVGKLRTLRALDWHDRWSFFRAWAWLCLAKSALATVGLRRALTIIAGERGPVAGNGADSRRDAKWIPIAARYVPGGASCLVRSLGLVGVLRRRGIRAELRIGVGDTRPALEAHAWVEVDGVPVSEPTDVATHYRAFGTSAGP